jgi:probable HAF family extracellular repeat protein
MASRAARALPTVALVTVTLMTGAASAVARGSASYRVRDLPSLGGLVSGGVGIDDRDRVAGSSDLAGDAITHAALWRHGRVTDLGTLGGPNSAVVFPGHDDHFVIGVAETATVNPDGEDWSCTAFFIGPSTKHDCVGFVRQHGRMTPLPTLGGANGFAAGADRLGQIVGWAENGKRDASCTGSQVRQFRAVRWDAGTHRPHELAPLPGDSTSAATAINDRGQVVGISGACGTAVGGVSATHAVLWDARGRPHDLGNLGGSEWNTPLAINDSGVVAGFANVPGGATPANLFPHAFVWTARTGMQDLHTLPGDVLSEGLGLNDRGQVVGESCQAHLANCRAFLWQGAHMTNLNDLVGSRPGTLVNAGDINDRGTITGAASEGDATVAFVARLNDR